MLRPDPPLGEKDWVRQVSLPQKVSVQTSVCTACCFLALCEDRGLRELNRVHFHSQGPEPHYVAALKRDHLRRQDPALKEFMFDKKPGNTNQGGPPLFHQQETSAPPSLSFTILHSHPVTVEFGE